MNLDTLKTNIKDCQVCAAFLDHGCNPQVQVSKNNKVLIIGQAPGLKVHENGQLWLDKSGDALRGWLGVDKETFYHSGVFGLLPMGFCYPGKGKSGDLPPRPECAPLWHPDLLAELKHTTLTLLVGQYSQKYYLKHPHKTLTDTVRNYQNYLPQYLPLPHPSPRNFIWQSKNPWFKNQVIPELQQRVKEVLQKS